MHPPWGYGRIYIITVLLLVLGFIFLRLIKSSSPVRQRQWNQDTLVALAHTDFDDEQALYADHPIVNPETLPTFPDPPQDVQEAIDRNLDAGRYLITAVVNSGMLNYTLNWVESLRRTGYQQYLIFCIDDAQFDTLSEHGLGDHAVRIPPEWFHVHVSANFESYGGLAYKAITHAKSLVVEWLLHMNVTVVFSDVDIVILKPHILDYLRTRFHSRPGTIMLFSVEFEHKSGNVVNSGFYAMRPSNTSRWVIRETISVQDRNPDQKSQQEALNIAVKMVTPKGSVATSQQVALLDVFLFPNGNIYFFEEQSLKGLGVDPFMVHANFFVGNDKKEALKKGGLWYLDD